MLDFLLFSPASTSIALLFLPFLFVGLPKLRAVQALAPNSFYALIGFFSYQFPFRVLRRKVQAWAIRRLNRFNEAVSTLVKK